MSVARDVLFLRRPKFDYVSPPVCEALFSGSGSPIIILDPFDLLEKINGIVIEGGGGVARIVTWPAYPGAICYTIYLDEDGVLTVLFECVTDTQIELPEDIEGVIRITPITGDGEGPISDPITIPPGGGGGEDCEPFVDPTGADNSAFLPNLISRTTGMVIGAKNFVSFQRPWVYFNRVSGDVRSARSSGAVMGSQSASDLVNADGNFFEAGDVGKFLKFTSGGDAREIILFNSPTQVQVATSDTVASSTFTIYGKTIGGESGGADITNGAGHIIGNETDILGNPRTFWYNFNTGDFRDLGDLFTAIPIALNDNGFFLFNNGTDGAIYDPGTQGITVLPSGFTPFDLNKNLLVVGHVFIDHFPAASENQAAKWESGVTTNIHPAAVAGTGPSTFARAEMLNEAGLIIGRYTDAATGRDRTFYNNGGSSASIGFLVAGVSSTTGWIIASDMNEAGLVVGGADADGTGTPPTGISRGFKWSVAGGLVQLGVLPGEPDSYARGVNEAGIIVGVSGSKACIWLPGQTIPEDLHNYLPPASGWTLLAANAINDENEIVGNGILNGDFENFFLKICL